MCRQRKNIRLSFYDYQQNGFYFITLCSQNEKIIFSQIRDNQLILNSLGNFIRQAIIYMKNRYAGAKFDQFVIMPNHFHAIVIFEDSQVSLGRFVNTFKGMATRLCQKSIWQRGYYEHVIRNGTDLQRIQKYIENNPRKWELDKYYKP